jgi:hypothetical protein
MTPETIINRLTAEILHQTDIEGIRLVISMAFTAGMTEAKSNNAGNKPVASIDDKGNIIKVYPNGPRQAAKDLLGNHSNIARCARMGKWKASCYKWKYIKDNE